MDFPVFNNFLFSFGPIRFMEALFTYGGLTKMLLDELDRKILAELEDNARLTVQQISNKVGTKRTTTGYRLNKLISNNVLNFACIANIEVMDYQIPLGIGINVSPGKTEVVARRLAELPAVNVVSLVAGRYAIFAWCLFKDQDKLNRFFSLDFSQIQEIAAFETIYAYTWIRDSWRYFTPMAEAATELLDYNPNAIDLAIIKALQEDPRQSITNLARSAGCSKPVAKDHLNWLIGNRIIHLVSIINPSALGYQIETMILIKLPPNQTLAVANRLSALNFIRHVSLTTGNWQIFVSALFWNSTHMHKFLSETLTATPGITDFEVIQTTKTLKFSTNINNIV